MTHSFPFCSSLFPIRRPFFSDLWLSRLGALQGTEGLLLQQLIQEKHHIVRAAWEVYEIEPNVDELMACADIDGALVGGASLEAEGFSRIINFKK